MVKTGGNEYKTVGTLSMTDVTKPITPETEYGGLAVEFCGNRKKFGLTWIAVIKASSIVVGNDVKQA